MFNQVGEQLLHCHMLHPTQLLGELKPLLAQGCYTAQR